MAWNGPLVRGLVCGALAYAIMSFLPDPGVDAIKGDPVDLGFVTVQHSVDYPGVDYRKAVPLVLGLMALFVSPWVFYA